MNLWQEYRRPTSIPEAISDMQNSPAPVIPIAGGTDLLLDIKQGRHQPVHTLVDLTGVPEMNMIEMRDDYLYIGASVSVNRITSNPLVQENAQALVEACNLIAGPQIRNTATLGGNVAHALPAADGTIAMVALDAKAEVAGQDGLRRMPFVDLFLGPGKSAIDKTSEIITGFYLPAITQTQASSFNRIMRPQGVALPILNCAVWVDRSADTIQDIRIAVGPGGPTPFRATDAEKSLREQPNNERSFAVALKHLLAQAKFRTSPRRATADYRKHIVANLFKDTLSEAWQRAGK
jgi:xanthine dehydrogenase FAD-binding subunit